MLYFPELYSITLPLLSPVGEAIFHALKGVAIFFNLYNKHTLNNLLKNKGFMNTKKMKTLLSAFMLAALLSAPSYAQVTIGSNNEPLDGALLDLKQQQTDGTANSEIGMMLPRVNLTNLTDITADITGVTAAENRKYTGLTVYNVNKCFDTGAGKGGPGVYVWSGTQWQYIGTAKDVGSILGLLSSMYGTTDASGNLRVDIPSGLDARGTTIQPFDLTVNSDPLATLSPPTYDYSGGVVFTAPTWPTGPLAANPTVYSSLQATDMSGLTYIGTTTPWRTRETVLTFAGKAGCPPADVNRTVTLNQTNYAILAYNDFSPNSTTAAASDFITLRNTDTKTFRIIGNAGWKATVTDTKSIMTHTIPATGGADDAANGSAGNDYTLAGLATPNTKYETATILLEDNTSPKRAKDFTVTVVQCWGISDPSAVTTTATPAETSGANTWGMAVVRHQAKPNPDYDPTTNPTVPQNIYEEFYSADFGAAGRWMTTNLAAKAYDGIHHSTDVSGTATSGSGDPRTLEGPKSNSTNVRNTAYWCYPGPTGGNGTDYTSYNNNPHIGLLYTWDAATAGKGGPDGQGNTTDEGNYDEVILTIETGKQLRIQGICPAGWHLPSDREWSQLEEIIYEHPENYSSYADNSSFPWATWDPSWNTSTTSEYRPSSGVSVESHGKAMKDACGLQDSSIPNSDPKGISFNLAKGGFSALLVGYAESDKTSAYGQNVYFCSSSSSGNLNAWTRGLMSGQSRVYRGSFGRASSYPVRCKKD